MSNVNHPPKKKRKLRPRFIILYSAILAILIFMFCYLDVAGDRYEMHTFCYRLEFPPEEVNVSFENEGVVHVTRVYYSDDEELIVELASDSKGETDVSVTGPQENQTLWHMHETHISVNEIGMIIEHDDFFTNFSGYEVATYLFLGILALVLCVMLYSFFDCYKRSDYSYSMVGYGGVSVFLAVQMAILIYKRLNNVVNTFSQMIDLLLQTCEWFLILLLPLMLVMAVALSFSNIWLLRHEGFRPVNALGIILSVVWIAGIAFVLRTRLFGFSFYQKTPMLELIRYILSYVITYFECMLLSTAASAFLSSCHTPPYDRDYIIILGCAIRRDGTLTPLLRGRVDSALRFEKQQYEATGRHARFVPSGGQGPDEVISEGEAMERYLIEQGVEPERIVREDKSVNTYENMRFSRDRIMEDTDDFDAKHIAFATTNYHIFRGYILANKNGYEAQGISAKTKWYFFPNAFIREFIGLLVDRKSRHILIIALITLMAVGITLI